MWNLLKKLLKCIAPYGVVRAWQRIAYPDMAFTYDAAAAERHNHRKAMMLSRHATLYYVIRTVLAVVRRQYDHAKECLLEFAFWNNTAVRVKSPTAMARILFRVFSGVRRTSRFRSMLRRQEHVRCDAVEVVAAYTPASLVYRAEIDVIVPVYNGYEYLETLFQSLRRTRMKHRLIIVNDASPDERVGPLLERIAAEASHVLLIQNERNLGFVQSVNKALQEARNDVAIVNTDVEVPDLWLERLMYPILTQHDVASATPFTTSGTICSFPRFLEDNALFLQLDLRTVDAAFSGIAPRYESMPTGVGFCMGMSLAALKKVGYLDAETFYKGYGEENDWCQRAAKAGFRNVMVENLFVWHKHGGSFLSEDKKRYIERNLKLLAEKHPNYSRDVAEYIQEDPVRDIREYVKWQLIIARERTELVVCFDHDWGGGAQSYSRHQVRRILDAGGMVIQVFENWMSGFYLKLSYREESASLGYGSFEEMMQVLSQLDVSRIVVNELVAFRDVERAIQAVIALKEKKGCPLLYLFHDFYAICPSLYLLDDKGRHCRIPEERVCADCLPRNPNKFNEGVGSVSRWRGLWRGLFTVAEEIRFFSENTKEHFELVYGKAFPTSVVPHYVAPLRHVNMRRKSVEDTIVIAVIGNFMLNKGEKIVCEMRDLVRQRGLKVEIVLIGELFCSASTRGMTVHGKYAREELPQLLERYAVDIVFIASIWPETFSYTTAEAIMMDVPLASFDLGAHADRIRKYSKGVIVKKMTAEDALDTICAGVRRLRM